MEPLTRLAIAVRRNTLVLLIVPTLAVALAAGCGHHRRSALRPVYVNPAPVVTSGPDPCPGGAPCATGAPITSPAPAFTEPGDLSAPISPPSIPSVPKTDNLDRQSGSEEPKLFPAAPSSGEKPPPLLGPSARRPTNRRSAVGPGRRSGSRDRVSVHLDEPNELFLPPKADRAWRYIVLHHSDHAAGSYGQIDREHREKLGTQGCGYHFVVGNGSESKDGQIEVASRWLDQKAGAHSRDATLADANDYGIGVCVIGDLDESTPTPRQVEATRDLVAYLRDRYEIPADHVVPHAVIAQTGTSCPGKRFPVDAILDARGFASR